MSILSTEIQITSTLLGIKEAIFIMSTFVLFFVGATYVSHELTKITPKSLQCFVTKIHHKLIAFLISEKIRVSQMLANFHLPP